AINDDPNATPDSLLRDADVAMYQAKADGPGAVRLFDQSMRTRLSRSTALERLRHAITHGELSLRYEPVLAVRSGEMAGVRIELHWDDPLRGPVPAREFVPVLEETGLIVEVGAWMLAEACRNARRWRNLSLGRPALQVTVPIAVRQLAQASFRDRL